MGCIDSSIGMVMAVWVKKMSAYASSSVVCDQPERFVLHVRNPLNRKVSGGLGGGSGR